MIFHYADGLLQQITLDKGSKFEYPVDVKAQAGLNAGDDQFEMIEAGTDLSKTTNVGIPGVWMYQTNERIAIKPSKIIIIIAIHCTYVLTVLYMCIVCRGRGLYF